MRLHVVLFVTALGISACDSDEGEDEMCVAFCGQPVTCVELADGEPTGVTLEATLDWKDGECRPRPGNVAYTCDGLVTHEGERRGAWTLVSGETFDVCIDPEFGGSCARCGPQA